MKQCDSYEKQNSFIWRHTTEDEPRRSSGSLHYDSAMIFTYLIRGRGHILVEDNYSELHAGDIIIVDPHEIHRSYFCGDPIHERISVYVRPAFGEELGLDGKVLFKAFRDRPSGQGNVIPAAVAKQTGLQDLLMKTCKPKDAAEEAMLRLQVAQALLLLGKALQSAPQSASDPLISAVLEYVNAHLREPLTTANIADALFVNKSYLCRRFKQYMGVTLHQYISKKRICLAIDLLESGLSCTEACFQSGFGNYSGFYKYYQRYTGASPAEKKNTSAL